jgi:hypothetical protein
VRLRRLALAIAAALLTGGAVLAQEAGPAWSSLSPAQRTALAPLQRDWSGIDGPRKQKWLEIAARFPAMPPAERARVQARMTEWARMTPQERGRARLQFQEARQVPPQERQARWEAYQALPPEQKAELKQRATPPAPASRPPASASRKSNIVPNPGYAAPARPVAPTMVQATPGATTTLVTRPPAPPAHQQTGLPKIAATPGFVDSKTLLPKRGPQGAAAVRPAPPAPAAPASRP